MENSRFQLKRDHIDNERGVIITINSHNYIIIHVCLKGNPEQYKYQNKETGYTRQYCLQTACEENWWPCFSALHLSIINGYGHVTFYNILCCFIEFFCHHSIPIHFGSIMGTYENSGYDNTLVTTPSFIFKYAWHMLTSIGCQINDQKVNNQTLNTYIHQSIATRYGDDMVYYTFERLRRIAVIRGNYFLGLESRLSTIVEQYNKFYLNSIVCQMDKTWTNYVRIPWFCITPTRLIVKPFKFMRSNRVFRYVSNVSDCMAMVQFRDDTGSTYLPKQLAPFLKHYLEQGFWFGDRHYVYLHHAQSQIRLKQFYFYCEKQNDMTREQLENWMGHFDDEKLPAKNTARRTQPFSSTEETIEINEDLVDMIIDVKTRDGKYNFTDGVGQISSELNLQIHKAIGINVTRGDYISSVLQVRYAGCKGTLTVNPMLDGQQKQLLIRPSMNKFKSNHRILELCKRSLRRPLCLNRQVINLLSYRGISSTCLLVCQLQNLFGLFESLVSNELALMLLRKKVLRIFPWSAISYHRNLLTEPFFQRLLLTTITNRLNQIVTKAHICVSKARYMFGVVDEFEVLDEGQVFVQITNDDGTKTVLNGSIAITKNPCHHPGDLRVLQAVNFHCLHHIYDVVVFPKRGRRPHASEISGSDLDGDEYTVIWDPDLVPTSPNPTPYEYDSGPSPKPLDRVVTRQDRMKVIIDICEQDNLGQLSNIHLVFVDKFGIDSKEAMDLAAAISQELDSVKSGQHPYTLEEIRSLGSKAGNTRPDFMQTTNYKEYASEKILGKIFRSAQRLNNAFKHAFPKNNRNEMVSLDCQLLHTGYEQYINAVQPIYEQYQYEISEIIGSYGFSNEIDLFCCIDSFNMKANERSDIQQTATKLLKAVLQNIKQKVYDDVESFNEKRAKAAACYYVAYTDRSPKDKRMLSFAWLFANQLLTDDAIILKDEETTDAVEDMMEFDDTYSYSDRKFSFESSISTLPNREQTKFIREFELNCQETYASNNEEMITKAERCIELLIKYAQTIHSN